jgi:adenylate kinase family enzyme
MQKIAVFGKPANGKSTFSKQLAAATGIKLYAIDSILYQPNGEEVDRDRYEQAHDHILSSDQWIIEGHGPRDSLYSFYRRLEKADTLIYIHLPYSVSYWLVTKRLLQGLFKTPEGWPEGSSVLKGTIDSYKILRLCPNFWNDDFLQQLQSLSANKSLHVIRSLVELNGFVDRNVS